MTGVNPHARPDGIPGRSMTRRQWLAAVPPGTVAAGAALALAGCGAPPAPLSPATAEDSLASHAAAAARDAALARSASATAPASADALRIVTAQRVEHAAALRTEIARAAGRSITEPPASMDVERDAVLAGIPALMPGTPAGLDAVRAALAESVEATRRAAIRSTGYRAGLLASVSAACSAHLELLGDA
ncbi:hypothetical protein [Lolliginicoccus suaedae]|uniref:hypothetical protein n=1 Tax=Lolliginicoccus suaedae TaxID=2605429 RepID=UPI0011F066C7|nr:hypothetical protein [Lolliginicoccus suaedae]